MKILPVFLMALSLIISFTAYAKDSVRNIDRDRMLEIDTTNMMAGGSGGSYEGVEPSTDTAPDNLVGDSNVLDEMILGPLEFKDTKPYQFYGSDQPAGVQWQYNPTIKYSALTHDFSVPTGYQIARVISYKVNQTPNLLETYTYTSSIDSSTMPWTFHRNATNIKTDPQYLEVNILGASVGHVWVADIDSSSGVVQLGFHATTGIGNVTVAAPYVTSSNATPLDNGGYLLKSEMVYDYSDIYLELIKIPNTTPIQVSISSTTIAN